jgi:hypothetical protein
MGYETKIYVVEVYNHDFQGPRTGNMIASMELSKCGSGNFAALRDSSVKNREFDFALWALNPDCQQEGVELLREWADDFDETEKQRILDLSNDLEDGVVSKDCYGDNLGVMKVPDVIEALKKDQATSDPYRRFEWAIVLLESIWANLSDYEKNKMRVISYGH